MLIDWIAVISSVVAVFVLVSFYVSWRAGRLDALHTRVETAHAALDAALARRAAVVLELASAHELEPASSLLLADAAGQARRATEPGDRELAESALSRALRAVMDQPEFRDAMGGDGEASHEDELLAEVVAAAKRVHIARRFYNDAVAATREARASRVVGALRLAGRAPLPEFFEIDDEPPRFGAPLG